MWTSGTTGRPKPIRHTHTAYLELLDRVLGAPARRGSGARRAPGAEPHPRVDGAQRRPLQRAVRPAGRRRARDHGPLRAGRVRRARAPLRRSGPRCCRPRRWPCSPTPTSTDLAPLRYVRSITAPLSPLQARRFAAKFPVYVLNGYGQAEIGEVIGWTAADAKAHPDKIGAVGRPHPGVDIRLAADGRLLVRPPNTAVGIAERTDARRLRRHRRPRPHRRRRLRVDRGSGRRPDQPRRQQGLPRRGRGGAAPVAGGRRRRGGRPARTTGWARCRSPSSSATGARRRARRTVPRAPRGLQGARPRSTGSTSCPAARSARSCAETCPGPSRGDRPTRRAGVSGPGSSGSRRSRAALPYSLKSSERLEISIAQASSARWRSRSAVRPRCTSSLVSPIATVGAAASRVTSSSPAASSSPAGAARWTRPQPAASAPDTLVPSTSMSLARATPTSRGMSHERPAVRREPERR